MTRIKKCLLLACIFFGMITTLVFSQKVSEYRKWMRVGMLRAYFANYGAEYQSGGGNTDPTLMWPAQYYYQGCSQAKSMWLGCQNYTDRNGITYPYKVLVVGPRVYDPLYQIMPTEFTMIGKKNTPLVYVDGRLAADNTLYDIVDQVSETLVPDRLIVNKLRSYIGVDVTRKIMAFSQQYHDNYYIYDYVFKNTGVIDRDGNTDPKTIEDFYVHFQYRYASGFEANQRGWTPQASVRWGRNTVNDVVWEDPTQPGLPMRAQYSWYGPTSVAAVDDWGCPDPNSGRLGGIHYTGTVVLHADKSSTDHSNDFQQPTTTWYTTSDANPAMYSDDQFNSTVMQTQYGIMSEGHPDKTHAEAVGNSFADKFDAGRGTPDGGYSQGQGFGPYTLAPGDSIHIVLAEGIAGISREKSIEVGRNWYLRHANLATPQLILPDGSATEDEDLYKKLWVQTGRDSLFQTFRRAISCYEKDYQIPMPPPVPEVFEVNSGGDRIKLTWEAVAAEAWPNFDGYRIYRAVGKPDTMYQQIFECNAADVVNTFDDLTALPGFYYYYYLVSKDNGSTNDIEPGVPLESSRFTTMTNTPAFVRKTGIKLSQAEITPKQFVLYQNYPNPFNPSTQIKYQVKEACHVCLIICNLNGQIVRKLVNAYQLPGKYHIDFNIEQVPSGIYFYKIQMGNFQDIKKMIKIE